MRSHPILGAAPPGTGGGSDTASQILTKLSTVDGTGSGLDADTLDGVSSTSFALDTEVTAAVAAHVAAVDPHGDRAYTDSSITAASTSSDRRATALAVAL